MPSATLWTYLAEMLFLFFVFVAASTLVRAKPFHLRMQTARLLESPAAAFIAAQPQGRSKHIFTKKAETGKCIEMPFAVTTFPVKKYLRNDRSRFGDTNKNMIYSNDGKSERGGHFQSCRFAKSSSLLLALP